MRFAVFVAIFLIIQRLASAAAPITFETLEVGSRKYRNVTIISWNDTDVYFSHAEGVANARLKLLAPAVQKTLGYDPEAASKAEEQRASAEQLYQSNILATLSANRSQAGATNGSKSSSERSISDPLSSGSLIGKTGPNLDFGLWKNVDPQTARSKHVLLVFWESWSIPSVRSLSGMAGIQKSFADKLLVLGVSGSAGEGDASPTFPNTVDPAGKLANAAGAINVPWALLMNPAGTVLYQGHPAALSEANLAIVLKE